MGKIYYEAKTTDNNMMTEIINRHYSVLANHEVNISIIFVDRDDNDTANKPLIMEKGHFMPASVRVVSVKERLKNDADAEIYVDYEYWTEVNDNTKKSIIDGCLSRIEVKRDRDGKSTPDIYGRVQLKITHPEVYFYCNPTISDRYGVDAHDVKTFRKICESYGDTLNPTT